LEFWKRYVNAIDDIHFALGTDARSSRTRDFVELRTKMKGRTVPLIDAVSSNNAFVMTIGDLVVVEFSGRANALYGYDRRHGLPFDMSMPVVTAKDRRNSLKSGRRHIWLKHGDGIHGWNKWEEMFEATLREHFHVEPIARAKIAKPPKQSERSSNPTPAPDSRFVSGSGAVPYSRTGLNQFAAEQGLEVLDNTSLGGNLWIRSPQWSPLVVRVLSAWGFKFKAEKGWWK
jgi:hypothetical protein